MSLLRHKSSAVLQFHRKQSPLLPLMHVLESVLLVLKDQLAAHAVVNHLLLVGRVVALHEFLLETQFINLQLHFLVLIQRNQSLRFLRSAALSAVLFVLSSSQVNWNLLAVFHL